MSITKNFSLLELVSSETATRRGIDNKPSNAVVENLKRLVKNVLQPLRDWYGKSIIITSAYRSPKLNRAIGGSSTSDHCFGNAADFTVLPSDYRKVVKQIIEQFEYKQLIIEFERDGYPRWLHISYDPNNNRKQNLIAKKGTFGTKYIPFTWGEYDKIYK